MNRREAETMWAFACFIEEGLQRGINFCRVVSLNSADVTRGRYSINVVTLPDTSFCRSLAATERRCGLKGLKVG